MAPPSFCGTVNPGSQGTPGECAGENAREQHFGLPGLLKRHNRPLFWPAVGFLIGATCQVPTLKPSLWMLLLFAVAACLTCLLLVFRGSGRIGSSRYLEGHAFTKSRKVIVLLLIAAGYMAGSFRGTLWASRICDAEELVYQQARTGSNLVVVQVVDNPRKGQDSTTFIGKLRGLIDEGSLHPVDPCLPQGGLQGELPARCKALKVNVHLYGNEAMVKPGDFVVVKGKLSIPSPAKNPGEFDYRRYLMGKQVFIELEGTVAGFGEVDRGLTQLASGDSRNGGWRIFDCTFQRLAHHIETRISAAFPGEQVKDEWGIVKALLLGDKRDLSPEDSEHFRAAGLYRFIAIAGFHVQLVAGAVERALRRLTKHVHVSRMAGIIAALLLAGLSGWSVGPLRAFLCVLLRHVAFWCRRKYDTLAAFAVSSIIIGWRIPYPLMDVSFQLSFAGMLAGCVAREWTQAFTRKYELGLARRSLLQSFLIAALLLPLLATHFQDVSIAGFFLGGLWALLSVAVTLSTLPVLCLPTALAGSLGWFPFFVGRGLRQVSSVAAKLPMASLACPAPKSVEIVSYLGLVFLLLDWVGGCGQATGTGTPGFITIRAAGARCEGRRLGDTHTPSRTLIRRLMVLILSSVLCLSVCFRHYVLWPQVIFLSVGQADSAVVRTKGAVIVVDTGTEVSARRVLVPYLKREGVRQIDLCIISHLHSDHVGGLGELCRNFKVRTVMTCPGSKQAVDQMARELMSGPQAITNATNHEALNIIEAGAGDVYATGGAVLTVLHPPKLSRLEGQDGPAGGDVPAQGVQKGTAGSANEDSLVIGIGFGDLPAHVEFWGDAPGAVVMELLGAWDTSGLGGPAGLEHNGQTGVVSIIKVPHHGSPDSLVYGFYRRVQSGVAVISVGPNSYGHPSPDVIHAAGESGLAVFRTDIDGAVKVTIYPARVKVSKFVK
ncbi:MAG: ComEC/Rec2 family competence protein [Bacillota bacterium]|jgi:competence protein ComEC|nr:DUF4131 domain-containing protein [Candidatus Fermentithermobacillaceae bacterium]